MPVAAAAEEDESVQVTGADTVTRDAHSVHPQRIRERGSLLSAYSRDL